MSNKDNMLSSASGMDFLKAGFINLFISNEKIEQIIEKEMPKRCLLSSVCWDIF